TFASVPSPILVRDERGTGKELLARYIHKISNRSEHPYVIVNCADYRSFNNHYNCRIFQY
ncbi:MAG: sigma-54 factor interaction domain-containing protein, partial [Candidatus Dadabacteria bacterium]|nr:sigma-54 factor interaction domain-containing protein [Candidatus Dadabacteria bacterium]NIS08280.1 sigma-54 factor interaction domain-containing protein [Candidatus Dadabacteria bacterium]NIY21765.1 hypothetical protein [Candidatus Dadabacteria bacterium]